VIDAEAKLREREMLGMNAANANDRVETTASQTGAVEPSSVKPAWVLVG
jgi:hypothetical protein